MAITGNITINATIRQTKDVTGNGTLAEIPLSITQGHTISSGTGANAVDRAYVKRDSVTAASADTIDLSGSLTDAFGDACVFAEVSHLIIKNNSSTAGENLLIGGGSNPFLTWLGASGDVIKVPPGGVLVLTNPLADAWAVTAGTGDILTIDASTGTVSYDIMILGHSA